MRDTTANPRNGAAPTWSEEQTSELKRLWAKGFTGGEIAKRVGRTRGQVMGKLGRLKLLGKISEREWGPVPPAEVKRRIAICRECVMAGQCVTDASKALDLGYDGLVAFLNREGQSELHAELAANGSAAAWRKRRAA